MKANDIMQFCGLPYIVTKVYETNNPELFYKERFTAKCFINNREIDGAASEEKNPYFNINRD